MSYDLVGRQVGLSYTPATGGNNIKVAEGVVVDFRPQANLRDFTPWAANWTAVAAFSRSWTMRLRCTVNSGTGTTDGNPRMPTGVVGTLTLYKKNADQTTGKWVGTVLPQMMVLQADGRRGDSEQVVEWTLIGNLGITETP